VLWFVNVKDPGINYFRFLCLALGTCTGYWALFVQVASESIGTNIRSTVTNTVPNFVRGSVVPITLGYKYLSDLFVNPALSAVIIGAVCIGIALWAVLTSDETFHKDLDYVEAPL
jgi:hypothetical protein